MESCQPIKRLKDKKKIIPSYDSLKIRLNGTTYKLHDIRPLMLLPFLITVSTSRLIRNEHFYRVTQGSGSPHTTEHYKSL
jgi:hypothetical protein